MMKKTLLLLLVTCMVTLSWAQYAGMPWGDANGGRWKFGQDTVANFTVGSEYFRGTDQYSGVPGWAYDIGQVDTMGVLPAADAVGAFVAGYGGSQQDAGGQDLRGNNKGGRTLLTSDDESRTVFSRAGIFKSNVNDYRFNKGGAWTRYSCTFDSGQYVLLSRNISACNGNFGSWVTIYDQNMNVVAGSTDYNQGTSDSTCGFQNNVSLITFLAPGGKFDSLTIEGASHWVAVTDTFNLAGDVVVEISDTDPVNGASGGARGVLGEFTFLYVGGFEVPPPTYTVTLAVDMNEEDSTSVDGVYVAGNFQEVDEGINTNCNNFADNCTVLDDSDGNGVWTTSIQVPAGTYEYKYINGMFYGNNEGSGLSADCGVEDGFGAFNRVMTISGDTTIKYVYNTCDLTTRGLTTQVEADLLPFEAQILPNPMSEYAIIQLKHPEALDLQIAITTLNGQTVRKWEDVQGHHIKVLRSELGQGMYLVHIFDNQGRSLVKKLIVQ